jgi:DNA polymerase III epsilon subunit-like protein
MNTVPSTGDGSQHLSHSKQQQQQQQLQQPFLSKLDRRKLKKLTKRACNDNDQLVQQLQRQGEQSGLLTRTDVDEFYRLMNAASSSTSIIESCCSCNDDDDADNHHQHNARVAEAATAEKEENLLLNPNKIRPILLGPSIYFRYKKKKKEFANAEAEGVHHRDLLVTFLHRLTQQQEDGQDDTSKISDERQPAAADNSSNGIKSKKRPHQETCYYKFSIPHWASIHNPAAVEQVVILEVHVPATTTTTKGVKEDTTREDTTTTMTAHPLDRYADFLKTCCTLPAAAAVSVAKTTSSSSSSTSPDESTLSMSSRSSVGLRTKWFSGHVPHSMSECLLYMSSNVPNNIGNHSEKKKKNKTGPLTREELLQKLEGLLLMPEEMIREGYPLSYGHETNDDSTIRDDDREEIDPGSRIQEPASIVLEDARTFVRKYGNRVEGQNINDTQFYIHTRSPKCGDGNSHNKQNNADQPPRVFGLDCEMVMTELGQELGRITMLQFQEFVTPQDNNNNKQKKRPCKTTVILDCLVRPENKIVDYLTEYSGITIRVMEPVVTRLEQVQFALANFLKDNDILVGHSLENDLKALHYIHPRVVDTAMIFRVSNKRTKFSLRHLSASILRRTIQDGSHCSEEDAQATLDLALWKAYLGDELKVPGGDPDKQSILPAFCPTAKHDGTAAAVFIGPLSWLKRNVTSNVNAAHALSYDSVDECKKAILSWMNGRRKAQLIWSNLTLSNDDTAFDKFRSLVVRSIFWLRSGWALSTHGVLTEFFSFAHHTFQQDIVGKLPPVCVLAISVQHGLQQATETFQRRRACQDRRSSVGWSEENELMWQNQLNQTRFGHVQWFGA